MKGATVGIEVERMIGPWYDRVLNFFACKKVKGATNYVGDCASVGCSRGLEGRSRARILRVGLWGSVPELLRHDGKIGRFTWQSLVIEWFTGIYLECAREESSPALFQNDEQLQGWKWRFPLIFFKLSQFGLGNERRLESKEGHDGINDK